jgi:hypothetical protein
LTIWQNTRNSYHIDTVQYLPKWRSIENIQNNDLLMY